MIITRYAIIVAGDGWNEVISVLFFIKKNIPRFHPVQKTQNTNRANQFSEMLIDNGAFPGRDMGAFKYYISMFVGTGVRSQNADTADADKGG